MKFEQVQPKDESIWIMDITYIDSKEERDTVREVGIVYYEGNKVNLYLLGNETAIPLPDNDVEFLHEINLSNCTINAPIVSETETVEG